MSRLEEMVAGFRAELLETCAGELNGVSTFADEAARIIEDDCSWVIGKAPDEVWSKVSPDGLGRALWSSVAGRTGGLGELDLGDWSDEVNKFVELRGRCRAVVEFRSSARPPGKVIGFSWTP